MLINNIFKPITEIGLDWCKLLVATSCWVSGNYIIFARVCKWFYYPAISLQEKERYTEPVIDVKRWYVKMCREWLRDYRYKLHGKARIITIKGYL